MNVKENYGTVVALRRAFFAWGIRLLLSLGHIKDNREHQPEEIAHMSLSKPLRTALSFLLAVLILSTPLQAAEVYKSVDKDGKVVFTDNPDANAGAEAVEVQEPNTVPATPTTFRPGSSQENAPANFSIAITSPGDQQRLPNRLAGVTVEVAVTPKMMPGFKTRLLLNGSVQAGSGNQFVIKQLPLGESTLQAELLNNQGKVISQSATITIFAAQPG